MAGLTKSSRDAARRFQGGSSVALAFAALIGAIVLSPLPGHAQSTAAQVEPAPPPKVTPSKRYKTPRKPAVAHQGEVRLEPGGGASLSPPARVAPLLLALPPPASSGNRPLSRIPLPSDAAAVAPPDRRAAVIDDAPLQETQIAPVLRSENKPFIPNVDTSGLRQKGIEIQLRTPF